MFKISTAQYAWWQKRFKSLKYLFRPVDGIIFPPIKLCPYLMNCGVISTKKELFKKTEEREETKTGRSYA